MNIKYADTSEHQHWSNDIEIEKNNNAEQRVLWKLENKQTKLIKNSSKMSPTITIDWMLTSDKAHLDAELENIRNMPIIDWYDPAINDENNTKKGLTVDSVL